MHLCLSHSPSPQQLPRPGLVELQPQASFYSFLVRLHEPQRPKKRVVFADTKGISLTSVHKFEDAVGRHSEEASCPMFSFLRPAPPGWPEPPPTLWASPHPGRVRGFQRRLQVQSVRPEQRAGQGPSCEALSSRQAGFQKARQMRITFDVRAPSKKCLVFTRPVLAEARLTASPSKPCCH